MFGHYEDTKLSGQSILPGLVSTIIPVFNRPALAQEAIGSVLAQTYRPIEILVVDDGSTDGTPEVLKCLTLAHPAVLRVFRIKNGGAGAARETGRQQARGEYIQYLDSDDLLMPNKFELQVEALRLNPDCGVAYGKTRFYLMRDGPRDVPWKRTGERFSAMFPSFLQSRWWGTSTPLYRRTVIDGAGAWLPLKNEEDWEYDCRIAATGTRLIYIDAFVSDQRWDGQPRLSMGGTTDSGKLRDRAQAHLRILAHARRFGIRSDQREMRHFARELFLLARQCGAAGLADSSRKLFDAAREASEPHRRYGLDFLLYRLVAGVIGWREAGCLAQRLDQSRGIAGGPRSHLRKEST